MKQTLIILLSSIILLASCNKEKRYSKRWQQKEDMSGAWQVSELTVDDVSDTIIPALVINDCDIYEDTCTGVWKSGEQEQFADFVWQFQNKGKEFVLLRQNGVDSCNFITDISEIQCYNYSGTYQVIKAKKKEMIFESNATVGYAGKQVRLVLQRKED